MERKGKTFFWVVLAVFYLTLMFIALSNYLEIESKVGNIYVGREVIVIGNLNETEKTQFVDLSQIFRTSAMVNFIGFGLAFAAALLSAKW